MAPKRAPGLYIVDMRPELIMLDEEIDGDLVTVTVVLVQDEVEFRGVATGPSDVKQRLDVISEATLKAAQVASNKELVLEFGGMAITDLKSKPIALALLRVQGETSVFVGTARVRNDGVNKAVARAIMDAVNRPLFG